MQIVEINNSQKFDQLTEDWRTLNVWSFGPLADLDSSDEEDNIRVLVGLIDNRAAAYLIAEDTELWHIETKEDYQHRGCARLLVQKAKIDFVYEVCTDEGAAFFDSLEIDYEDCR